MNQNFFFFWKRRQRSFISGEFSFERDESALVSLRGEALAAFKSYKGICTKHKQRKPIDTMLCWRQHSSFNICANWISSENWFSVLAQTLLGHTIPAPRPGRSQIPVYRRAFTITLMIQESFPSSFINKTENGCFKDWSKLKSVPFYTLNIEIKEEKMRTFIDFIKYKTNLAGTIKLKLNASCVSSISDCNQYPGTERHVIQFVRFLDLFNNFVKNLIGQGTKYRGTSQLNWKRRS